MEYADILEFDYQQRAEEEERWQERYDELINGDYSPLDFNNLLEAACDGVGATMRHEITKALQTRDYAAVGMALVAISERYWERRAEEDAND